MADLKLFSPFGVEEKATVPIEVEEDIKKKSDYEWTAVLKI